MNKRPAEFKADMPGEGRQELTEAQLKFWVAWRAHRDRPIDSRFMRISWKTALDADVFATALREVVARTDSLRLVFNEDAGHVYQEAAPVIDPELAVADFSNADNPAGAAHDWLDGFSAEPFDLTRKNFSTALAKVADNDWLWQFNQHHIVTDFTTASLLIARLSELYGALKDGSVSQVPPYPSYLSFLDRHRDFFFGDSSGGNPDLDVPRLCPTVPKERRGLLTASTGLKRKEVYLGAERLARAAKLFRLDPAKQATRLHSLLYNLFLATTAVLTARISDRSDVTLGTPTHNRYLPGADEVMGLFIRTLPLHLDLSQTPALPDVLSAIQKERRKIFAAARAGDHVARRPFNVMVNHITSGMADFQGVPSTDLTEKRVADAMRLDLSVTIRAADVADDVKILFDVNEDILDQIGLDALATAFVQIFDAYLDQSDAQWDRLALTGPDAVEAARETSRRAADITAPPYSSLVEGFVAQAAKTPDAVAVSGSDRSATYADVEQASCKVATALIRRGVKPGDFVALRYPRSVELVIAMLGILRSGGAIVGLDSDVVDERARIMAEDTDAALAIVETPDGASDWAGERPVRPLSELFADCDSQTADLPYIDPEAASYVMYTSGTTGVPKGIVIPHGSAARAIHWFHRELAENEPVSWALASTLSFEAPYRVFTSLISGGHVAAYPDPVEPGRIALMDALEDDTVDAITVTPSQLRLLVRDKRPLRRIRTIQVIGEQFPVSLARAARDAFGPDVSIENWYGPTETTMATTRHVFDDNVDVEGILPIGRPAPDSTVHVLDAGGNPVPRGALGEFCIGGVRLSKGYLNQPDLTAASFVPDPFIEGGLLYRSGDIGRIDGNGNLVHHGRRDHQVKVNGVRIELPDVETALLRHEDVTDCAVVPVGTEVVRLAGFYVSDRDIPAAELREDMSRHVSTAMVPTSFARLDSIPLTKSGKAHRRILQDLAEKSEGRETRGADEKAAPRTGTERKLAEIWGEILEVDPIHRSDNFFDAGGDSLTFVHMVLATEETFGVKFPPTAIDGQGDLSTLASLLDDLAPAAETAKADIPAPRTPAARPPVLVRLADKIRNYAANRVRMHRLRAAEPATASGISEELLRQLRLSVAGWPGESLSDVLPVFGFNTSGGKPPIFWCFNGGHEPPEMEKRLGSDQPIYAFRSMSKIVPDMNYRRRRTNDLAQIYAKEIKRLCPDGPYMVGGNCQGGRIAEYVARALMMDGNAVPQLSLLDYVPATPYPGRLALFFGRESTKANPFFHYRAPDVTWRHMHKDVVWDIVPGDHAQYFIEPNVGPFLGRLQERLAEALKAPPFPLGDGALRYRITPSDLPEEMRAGETTTLTFYVANESPISWRPLPDGVFGLAGVWKKDGKIDMPAGQAPLLSELDPGDKVGLELEVTAPDEPGRYALVLDMGVAGLDWFNEPRQGTFEANFSVR